MRVLGRTLLLGLGAVAVATGVAYAKGGTAKPPTKTPPPAGSCPSGAPPTSACIMPPAGPVLLNFPAGGGALSGNGSNGFSITGYIQAVTTATACATVLANQAAVPPIQTTTGGTVTVNSIVIGIPSDVIVQYPANTLTWADAVCGVPNGAPPAVGPPIALNGTGGAAPALYPGVEITVDGNIVGAPGVAPAASPAAGIASPHIAHWSKSPSSRPIREVATYRPSTMRPVRSPCRAVP